MGESSKPLTEIRRRKIEKQHLIHLAYILSVHLGPINILIILFWFHAGVCPWNPLIIFYLMLSMVSTLEAEEICWFGQWSKQKSDHNNQTQLFSYFFTKFSFIIVIITTINYIYEFILNPDCSFLSLLSYHFFPPVCTPNPLLLCFCSERSRPLISINKAWHTRLM